MKEKLKDEYKVVVLGDKGVGKTSLVLRYIQGYFSPNQQSTIAAFFLTRMRIAPSFASTLQMRTLSMHAGTGSRSFDTTQTTMK